MKLIITGATGFVATEVVRQALKDDRFTSVVALARKPVEISDKTLDTSKLKCVTIDDYSVYPDRVKKEFAGADACIWTVAITPFVAKKMDFAEVKRVCQDSVMKGLDAIRESGVAKPFRFLYMSGDGTPRTPEEPAPFFEEYARMRGDGENQILAWAAARKGEFEVTVAKPGYVYGNLSGSALATVFWVTGMAPYIKTEECAAAMLQQVVEGFEKDPLDNADLVRLGRAELARRKQ